MTESTVDVLLNVLLRAAALLVIATAVVWALRRTSASLRALVLTSALAGMIVLPLISLVAPSIEVAVIPARGGIAVSGEVAVAPAYALDAPQLDVSTDVAPPPVTTASNVASRHSIESIAPLPPPTTQISTERTRLDAALDTVSLLMSRVSVASILTGIWAIGALLLLVRLALGHKRLAQLVSSAAGAPHEWHAAVHAVRGELGIHRRVDVRTSPDIDVPAVAGVFSPVLLLPASMDCTTGAQRDVVLHELAHVARWDALAQVVSHVACAMYWFIPLTWHAARHATALREQACDNVVLRAGIRPSLYAERLLTFSREPMSTALEPVALAMARPAHITRRVLDILDTNTRRTRLSASFTTAFVAAFLALVALVAVVEPVAASEPLQARSTPAAPLPVTPVVPTTRNVPVAQGGPAVQAVQALRAPAAFTSPAVSPAMSPAPASPASPTQSNTAAAPSSISVPLSYAGVNVPVFTADVAQPVEVRDAVSPLAVATTTPTLSVPQQSVTICRNGTKNNSIHSNDNGDSRTWRLTLKGPGCDVDIRIEGKPVFNREFTDVVRIDGRGIFEFDIREDGTRRELLIRDNNGRLTRTWRVDGRERPYDADAAAWFAQALIAVDRATAFAAEARLPVLLERGGVNAVLAETGHMTSDYPRSVYYTALARARRLTSKELASILDQSAQLGTSDYYASELLKSVAPQGVGDAVVREGVMKLIARMKSDYYRYESIKAAVNGERPTSNDVGLLVQVIGTMESDYYRAESVKLLTRASELSSSQLSAVLAIAAKMKSDYHVDEMLGNVVARGTLDADKRIAYLDATRAIESDYHRAEAVNRLLRNGAPTVAEMDAMFTTIAGIKSDHHMGEVLDRLLSFRLLRETDLLRAEVVARALSSDHTHSEALRRIGSHASATPAVRSAVHAAAQSLSSHYREQVQRAVER
jgi:beta-lactamase regulating signal transducer with metallopeptidase domain